MPKWGYETSHVYIDDLDRQRATPCQIFNMAYETGSCNNLASFIDNNAIPNPQISSTPIKTATYKTMAT